MRCRYMLASGDTCSRNRTYWNEMWCGQHARMMGVTSASPRSIRFPSTQGRPSWAPEPRVPVAPIAPGVRPDFLAIVLNRTEAGEEAKRTFAIEFAEAYREVDDEFDSEGFIGIALQKPFVQRGI
jgi:hypothetical protein